MVAKARSGRPRKAPTPGERMSLGLKVSPETKALLDAAASQSGRTQSQEAELRLENSFRDQRLFEQTMELAYGRQLGGFLMLLGRVVHDTATQCAFASSRTLAAIDDPLSDPFAFDQTARAIHYLLEAVRPEGEPVIPPPWAKDASLRVIAEKMGPGFATGALEAIKNAERGGGIGDWAKPIRALVGEAFRNRIRELDQSSFAMQSPRSQKGQNEQ